MTLLGLDINASRVRAVVAASGAPPRSVTFDEDAELPLAINLENRRAQVGRAGLAVCRKLPHLVCHDYLPRLGEPGRWVFGRHRLDAAKAVALLLDRLRLALPKADEAAVALPAYLSAAQVKQFADLAKKARLKIVGSAASPLAAVWAAQASRPWDGPALVLDTDDHALSWSAVVVEDGPAGRRARLVGHQSLPTCGLRAWKERLLNGIADHCIRQTRRDLRASAAAEQRLYNHLDDLMTAARDGKAVALAVEAEHWYQELVLGPDDPARFCGAILAQALAPLRALGRDAMAERPPELVLVTPAAARLPGLLAGVQAGTGVNTQVALIDADAVARGAREIAGQREAGAWEPGHHGESAPLPTRPRAVTRPASATTFPRPYKSRPTPPSPPAPESTTMDVFPTRELPYAEPVTPSLTHLDPDDDFSLIVDE